MTALPAYYNENDPFCCEWLRNLMRAGHITDGEVDSRSIVDVRPDDVRGFIRCHFFAGIGGWDLALRMAGWPDERPVWTGSCPCQPWSVSGRRRGHADERDLWPEWKRLIVKCRPATCFGEQVTGTPAWLGVVRRDLEIMDYAVGCMPIEAASADADHFRDRYWFVAHDNGGRGKPGQQTTEAARHGHPAFADGRTVLRALADGDGFGSQIAIGESGDAEQECAAVAGDRIRDVVDTQSLGWGEGWTEHEFRGRGFTAAVASVDDRQYVECPDGKWRRLPPPRVRWLGTRLPARVARLRAFGNAIDHRPARAFIEAVMGCCP